ncbi:pyridoxal 5'-phosphate synthase glutaminase subunit PdxT [Oerskovia gallyi]|uniref:Pyridoxal 5'-phosphate synthase subunit PdxT n=1 Tax=Oerskovia gallyi TaxID=2762226 RepID=A0ABR8V1Z4_9CELL|nr:pyridoxal 5'-phosphate synthase glutaminase subunit PdxT [Oerskovia gallyi]MBD7998808.1 pyridoxal 5'-phosphate synthase glutaminase subunit PdxT [Oerskovia gallyi]
MVKPVIGVLALQGDVREHVAALEVAGARAVTVRRPTELAAIDGLVLPGGESTTIDKLLRIFELFDPLRTAIGAGLPVYGSCAGMILLADRVLGATHDQQTLGGLDVTVRRNAFGRQVDSFESSVEMSGVRGGPVPAAFIRAPWVEETGPGVQVLARTRHRGASVPAAPARAADAAPSAGAGEDAGRIVAVRQGTLLATSFHPEITGDARVHELFVAIVKE